ncbi:hypothetical protein CPB85DRAFT_1319100 [Mucidula mucida]|nr:hypothetical protein CPB85DRAFT_1319100 [Mucidula mucida]
MNTLVACLYASFNLLIALRAVIGRVSHPFIVCMRSECSSCLRAHLRSNAAEELGPLDVAWTAVSEQHTFLEIPQHRRAASPR